VAPFANEVCDHPVLLSFLEMFHRQRGQFRTAEAASQEDSDHSVVTLATKIPIVEDCKKSIPLFSSQPVANPHAVFLDTFHASDACRKIRTKKSAIRSLVGEPANSCKTQVNGGRSMGLFQTYPLSGHHGFVKGQSRFRTIPIDEFTDGVIVRSLRTPRGEAV
jgi:hypothetical protein